MSDKGPDSKFNTHTEPYWTEAVEFAIAADPNLGSIPWNFIMSCPRCGHDMQTQIIDAPIRKAHGREKDTMIVSCNCAETHDGRPDDEAGCGNYDRFLAAWEREPKLGG